MTTPKRFEIGTTGQGPAYPDDDIQATLGAAGKWQFQHKNGEPY